MIFIVSWDGFERILKSFLQLSKDSIFMCFRGSGLGPVVRRRAEKHAAFPRGVGLPSPRAPVTRALLGFRVWGLAFGV